MIDYWLVKEVGLLGKNVVDFAYFNARKLSIFYLQHYINSVNIL